MANQNFKTLWDKYGTFGIFILLIIIMAILSPRYFFSADNLVQVILQSSINIIVGIGEFFAILIAGIDLSVGSIMALTGMLTAKFLTSGMPIFLAVLLGILMAAFLGLINGFLVVKTKLHPFIITLGTQSIFRGITLIISDARPEYGLPSAFIKGTAGWLGFIPIPVIIALIVVLITHFITTNTKMGRNIYALGGNSQAAWYSGINTNLLTMVVFVISGICAGIGGIVLTARVGAAEPLAGTGFETFAIAAAIIGGTSFFGGKGKVVKVMIGALIIGVINNGLNILSVPTYYQQIVMGALIIGAVSLDIFIANRSKKS